MLKTEIVQRKYIVFRGWEDARPPRFKLLFKKDCRRSEVFSTFNFRFLYQRTAKINRPPSFSPYPNASFQTLEQMENAWMKVSDVGVYDDHS